MAPGRQTKQADCLGQERVKCSPASFGLSTMEGCNGGQLHKGKVGRKQ